ncbi:hypothetical protein SLA2020_450660 [Shorea laevis]
MLSHEGTVIKHHRITTLKTLNSHISCLAVHDNLLYAGSTNTINVFDLSNYTLVDAFNDDPTSGSTKSIAFNATKIFTAHQDSKIRIWRQIAESKKHHLVSTLPTVKDRFYRSLLPKNYVQIWNVSNHRCLKSVKAHEDAVNAIVVSRDNGTVYTASADGCIRVWERNDGVRRQTLVTTLEKHKSTVNALALNGDGRVLFSGGCDRRILVWEKENGANNSMVFTEALWGHTGAILCLINVDDLLASGSSDRTVRIWQRGKDSRYHCMVVMEAHETPVKSLVAVSAGASNGVVSVCSGSLDGEIKIWEINIRTVPQI